MSAPTGSLNEMAFPSACDCPETAAGKSMTGIAKGEATCGKRELVSENGSGKLHEDGEVVPQGKLHVAGEVVAQAEQVAAGCTRRHTAATVCMNLHAVPLRHVPLARKRQGMRARSASVLVLGLRVLSPPLPPRSVDRPRPSFSLLF